MEKGLRLVIDDDEPSLGRFLERPDGEGIKTLVRPERRVLGVFSSALMEKGLRPRWL